MEKEKKGSSILTIILLIALVASLGYIAYDKLLVKEEPKVEDKKEPTKEEEKWEEVSKDSVLAKEAQGFVPNYICGGVQTKLEKKNKTISELDNIDKLNILLSKKEELLLRAADSGMVTVSEKEISQYFKDISFMESFKPSIDTTTEGLILPINMKYENGNYIFQVYGIGCTGGGNDGDYLYLIDAKKNDTTLIVKYLHYYQNVEYDEESSDGFVFKYKIKKEKDATEVIDTLDNKDDQTLEKLDKTKFDGYQYEFDIQKGNIYLEKINYLETLS